MRPAGRMRAAGGREPRHLASHGGAELPNVVAAATRHAQGIVAARHAGRHSRSQSSGGRAAMIDGEIIDHRLHGEGQACCSWRLGRLIDSWR